MVSLYIIMVAATNECAHHTHSDRDKTIKRYERWVGLWKWKWRESPCGGLIRWVGASEQKIEFWTGNQNAKAKGIVRIIFSNWIKWMKADALRLSVAFHISRWSRGESSSFAFRIEYYLVNTKHNNVADNIVNCCDNADCDFCIARCRSFWKCCVEIV